MLFRSPKFVSLILNVSLRTIEGRKIADGVKSELIDFVNTFEEEDQLYLSSDPTLHCYYNRHDIVETNGKRVAAIGNWHPKEMVSQSHLRLEIHKAFQAVGANGDIDGDWYICLITDRYKQHDEIPLMQMLNQNSNIWGEVKLIVITIGDHYDFKEYEQVCNECKYTHLSTPTGIKSTLIEQTEEKE